MQHRDDLMCCCMVLRIVRMIQGGSIGEKGVVEYGGGEDWVMTG